MKKVVVICLSFVLAAMLQGCGAQPAPTAPYAPALAPPPSAPQSVMPASAPAEYADPTYEADAATAQVESGSGGYAVVGGLPAGVEARKVVYSADFRIATEDFGATMRRLEQKIAVNGGYLQKSDVRAATEHSAAYASMTIRVPAALYGDFKNFLTDLAVLTSSTEHGEDVTAQYFDTEARLKVLQAQEERIKTFIANSKDLDEIFKIERELTRISTEIEQLTTVKNRLDNLTAYATVYVDVREIVEEEEEVEPEPEPEPEPERFTERVAKAFSGSFGGLTVAVQHVVLFIVWIWPLLALAAIVVPIWRGFVKRSAKSQKSLLPPAPEKSEDKRE